MTDGVKHVNTGEEKAAAAVAAPLTELGLDDAGTGDDALGEEIELEEEASIDTLTHLEKRVALDRVEIAAVRQPPAVVAAVDVDQVHYRPGETVKAVARLVAGSAGGSYTLVADDVTEIDDARRVFGQEVTLAAGQKLDVSFDYPLEKGPEFGHEVRCSPATERSTTTPPTSAAAKTSTGSPSPAATSSDRTRARPN